MRGAAFGARIAGATLAGALSLGALSSCASAPPPAPAALRAEKAFATRPIPLLRHAHSRAAQTSPDGFYDQPVALCDDYPEESTTLEKIRGDFAIMREAGVHMLRFGVGWDEIETSPGHYDFSLWDQILAEAEKAGITLLPYVCYTPEWATPTKKDFFRQPPSDPARFGAFMRTIALRYKGRIHSWELWNEPDLEAYWTGTADELAPMIIEGARQVRAADPSAVIVLGGMAKGRSPFFEELVREHRITDWVDVVNVHGYFETWSNDRIERYPARLAALADLLPKGRPAPDLWMAEFGYSSKRYADREASEWGVDVVHAYEHTPEHQAVALFESHVLALASGKLSLTAWYRIRDLPDGEAVIGDDNNRHLGIVDVNGRKKPSFYALSLYSRLFRGPTRPFYADQGSGPSDRVVYVFEKKNGDAVVVGWLRSATRGEVRDASGYAKDERRETVRIPVPKGDYEKLVTYRVTGEIEGERTFSGDALEGVELRGDRPFIAELRRR